MQVLVFAYYRIFTDYGQLTKSININYNFATYQKAPETECNHCLAMCDVFIVC